MTHATVHSRASRAWPQIRRSIVTLVALGTHGCKCTENTSPSLLPCDAIAIGVSPATAGTMVGGIADFTASVRFSSVNCVEPTSVAVTWTSSNPAIAALQQAGFEVGTFVGVAPGSVTITASYGRQSATAQLAVTLPPAARVVVTAPDSVLIVGTSMTLTAEVRDQNNAVTTAYPVTWQSSDITLATVAGANTAAVVTAVAKGNLTITATAGGVSGSVSLRVADPPVIPVARLKITGPNSVDVGLTISLIAIAEDASGAPLPNRQILWSSSAPTIATVSPSGSQVTVTGVAAGQTTITAASEGKSATHAVTVNLLPVASVRVSPAASTIRTGKFVQLTATALDRLGNVVTGHPVSWRSVSGAVASVSGNGLVTGVGVGLTTDIVATIGGVDGTAQVTSLARRLAYGVATQPQAATQTAFTAFNSTGGSIIITRMGLGRYRVNFSTQQRLPGETETVLISPYGATNTYCKLETWGPGAQNEMVADVLCFAFGATPADASFGIMLIGDGTLGGRLTFGLADQEHASVPYNASNSYNSTPGPTPLPVSVNPVGAGEYVVTFTGNGGGVNDAEAVHVTAVGASGARCNVASILTGDAVRVRCYAATVNQGPPVSSKFAVTLLDRGRQGEPFGLAYAGDAMFDEIETPGTFALPSTHAWTSAGSGVTLERLATVGRYDVVFHGLGATLNLGIQVVDRDSNDAQYCSVIGWSLQSADLRVSVQCWHGDDGSAEDEAFYIVVIR